MVHPFSQVIAELSEVVSEYAPNLNQHVLLSLCASQLKAAGIDCSAESQRIQHTLPGADEKSAAIGVMWGIFMDGEVYTAQACGWAEIMASKIASYEARLDERGQAWTLTGPSKPVDEDAEMNLFLRVLVLGSKSTDIFREKRKEMNDRMLAIAEHYAMSQGTPSPLNPIARIRF